MKKIYHLHFKLILFSLLVLLSSPIHAFGTDDWFAGKSTYKYTTIPQKRIYATSFSMFDNTLPDMSPRFAPFSVSAYQYRPYPSRLYHFNSLGSHRIIPNVTLEYNNGEWRSTSDRLLKNSFRFFSKRSETFVDYRFSVPYEGTATQAAGGTSLMQNALNEADPAFPGDPGQFYQPVGGGVWILLLLGLIYSVYQRKNFIFNLIKKF